MSTELEIVEKVETGEKPNRHRDGLYHLFCTPCRVKDTDNGVTPVPYCGKKQKAWNFTAPSKNQNKVQCIMCADLIKVPCERCGHLTEKLL